MTVTNTSDPECKKIVSRLLQQQDAPLNTTQTMLVVACRESVHYPPLPRPNNSFVIPCCSKQLPQHQQIS